MITRDDLTIAEQRSPFGGPMVRITVDMPDNYAWHATYWTLTSNDGMKDDPREATHYVIHRHQEDNEPPGSGDWHGAFECDTNAEAVNGFVEYFNELIVNRRAGEVFESVNLRQLVADIGMSLETPIRMTWRDCLDRLSDAVMSLRVGLANIESDEHPAALAEMEAKNSDPSTAS